MPELEGQSANPAEETVETPETEDFAGYENLEAMKAAIYESRKEGKRLAKEVAEKSARLSDLERRLPSERATERRALDEINDLGLPADLFERAVDERLERALAPKRQTDAAVANIRRSNPDFARFETKFTDWLADNPQVGTQYANTVAAAPDSAELALEGVFAKFSREAAGAARKEGPSKISPDASLPSTQGGSGAARRAAAPKITAEEYSALIKAARDTGDPVPLMRRLIGNKPVHRDIEAMKG